MICHRGHSRHIVKNGVTSSSGKQNYLCRNCERQFVENPTRYCIDQEKRVQVDCLLLEEMFLLQIA